MKASHFAFAFAFALPVAIAIAGAAGAAGTPVLPAGTPIRVLDDGLGAGWHDGKIGVGGEGCTMVFLNQKSKSGYTAVSFAGKRRLMMQKSGVWIDVPVRELNRRQPKSCQDGGDND